MMYSAPVKPAKQGITWRTKPTAYVDIDTGETLTAAEAKSNYIVINTEKIYNVKQHKSFGTIVSIKKCRRNPQGTLFE